MIDPHLAPPPDDRLPSPRVRAVAAAAAVVAWAALLGGAWLRDQSERRVHASALLAAPGEAPNAMPPPAMGGGAVGGGRKGQGPRQPEASGGAPPAGGPPGPAGAQPSRQGSRQGAPPGGAR